MLLTSNIRARLIDVLLLNIYAEKRVGYAVGKTGMAVTLLNVSRKLGQQYEYLEDHAISVLEETLAMEMEEPAFMNGNAGIGFGLHEIITDKLIDGDYDELFASRHDKVIAQIKALEYDEKNPFDCLDYLFFVNAVEDRISCEDKALCDNVLERLVDSHMSRFQSEFVRWNVRNMYYVFAIRLMAVINSLQSYSNGYFRRCRDLLLNNEMRLHTDDYISQYPIYYSYLYLTDLSFSRNEHSDESARLFDESLKNIITETLSFKELADVVYLSLRIKSVTDNRRKDLLSETIDRVTFEFTDDDIDRFECKLNKTMFASSDYNLGIYGGLCRLLILDCFWADMVDGVFPKSLTRLLF